MSNKSSDKQARLLAAMVGNQPLDTVEDLSEELPFESRAPVSITDGSTSFSPIKKPYIRQRHEQTLWFKQTIIPILLTVGLLSLGTVALGYLSDVDSPFVEFRQVLFSVPLGCIGVCFLGLAAITMLQVRHKLNHNGAK
jgi:hypothetical protein